MASKIRILIADDSAFMRLIISDILEGDKDLEVIAAVSNGLEASHKTKELKPDVVVLDMNMGEYDGLYAVKAIMKESPVPILILSAVGNKDLEPIFEALKLGAVDYINKPNRNNSKMREIDDDLILKIKRIAKAKPKLQHKVSIEPVKTRFMGKSDHYDAVVIGASTGGPTALEQLLTSLPEDMNVPVLVAQHMPPNFIHPFVNRLNQLSSLEIVVGTRFMVPRPGMIIFSPGDSNMIVTKEPSGQISIGFDDAEYDEYNHPSINALMLSAASVYGERAIGVILTGMGKDGVRGLGAIRKSGGYTIAQDRSSSVIYGMPKAAYETGAAMEVLDLKEIGNYIVNKL